MGALLELFAYQVYSRDYISPLIVAAHLQTAIAGLRQMVEIVRLEQHVVKLDEIEAGFHPDFVAFGGKHPVDTEVPADIAQEIRCSEDRQASRRCSP